MSNFANKSIPALGDGIDLTTPLAEAALALTYLDRHDATDCAEALGLAPYTGHARTFRNGSTHAVERGAR